MHRFKTGQRGFTLVEILCVVVILGIAAGIILPQLGSRNDMKTAAAARMLISDLIYAQNLAISTQRKHFVQFTGQQYTLLIQETEGATPVAITHPITKDTYAVTLGNATRGLEGVTIDSVSIDDSAMILGFDDLGMPLSWGASGVMPITNAATITLKAGDISMTVRIEPFTGEASVQ